jgi:hypothetical protein
MNPLAEWPYRCFKTSMTQTGSTSTPANVRIALAPQPLDTVYGVIIRCMTRSMLAA